MSSFNVVEETTQVLPFVIWHTKVIYKMIKNNHQDGLLGGCNESEEDLFKLELFVGDTIDDLIFGVLGANAIGLFEFEHIAHTKVEFITEDNGDSISGFNNLAFDRSPLFDVGETSNRHVVRGIEGQGCVSSNCLICHDSEG
jgi:hypothetical protein